MARARNLAAGRRSRRALDGVVDLLARAVEASDAVICIAGVRGGAVGYVSPAAAARLGLEPRDLVGKPLAELVEPEARDEVGALLDSGADVKHLYLPLLDVKGNVVQLDARIAFGEDRFVLIGDARRAGYDGREGKLLELNDELVVQAREGFRRAHRLERTVHELEHALEESAGKLQGAFRRTMRVRDEERRRILRDLHDGTQQHLLAVGIGLDALADRSDDPGLRTSLLQLRRRLDDALVSLRDLARGIYPAALSDHGIAEGVRAASFGAVPPVEVHAFRLRRYPAEIEGAVYFSCVEAIQNAVKHAGASRIVVELAETDEGVYFAVRDDGSGFDPRRSRAGSGLRNVADRVRGAGGTLKISSTIGVGTTVSGSVPVEENEP